MEKGKIRRTVRLLICLAAALYVFVAMRMDVSPTDASVGTSMRDALAACFGAPGLTGAAMSAVCLALICGALLMPALRVSQGILTAIPAAFLALCMLVGRAFIDPEWGNLAIRPQSGHVMKWLFCLPGWFLLCFSVLRIAYAAMDKAGLVAKNDTHTQAWCRLYDLHPFAVPFIILLVCYLPVTVLSMPGIVVPEDTVCQIGQFYGIRPGTYALIYSDSMLNNHHPMLHSMLLHSFVSFCRNVIGSAQAGLGLFVCVQVLLTALAVSFALCELHREGVPAGACLVTALFLGLHPRIQNLVVMVSKDMLYACILLVFGVGLLRVIKSRRVGLLWLLFASLGMVFLRNEGIYILLGAMALLFAFAPCGRKAAASVLLICLTLLMLWTDVVFPAMHISPGSKREMLSIPFQQTARYVQRAGERVTQQEREIIDRVLPYDALAGAYSPNLADSVKNSYRQWATDEELAAYLKTWAAMFVKQPMIYVEAFLENKNLLLYPSTSSIGLEDTAHYYWISELDFGVISERCAPYGIALHYPEALKTARMTYERMRERIFSLPGLRLFTQNSPIVWVIAALAFYALSRKKWNTLLLMAPAMLQLLVIFVSPMDGNSFRYIYPLALYVPLVLLHAVYIPDKP